VPLLEIGMQPINTLDASRRLAVSAKGLWLGVQKDVCKLVNVRGGNKVAYVVGFAVVIAAVIGIVKFISDDRCAKMT
jgi:hypothetical protein